MRCAETEWLFLSNFQSDLLRGRSITRPNSPERLTRHFIGCNAIVDLAETFYQIDRGSTEELVEGVSYRDLLVWLQQDKAEVLDRLLSQESSANVELDARTAWQRIHLWLAVDGIAKILGSPSEPRDFGLRIFKSALPCLEPKVCSQRSERVLEAFSFCWDKAAAELKHWIAEEFVEKRPWTREELGQSLCEAYLQDVLPKRHFLTSHMLNQLTTCRGRLPKIAVIRAEIDDFTSRLLAQLAGKRDFVVGKTDLAFLEKVRSIAQDLGYESSVLSFEDLLQFDTILAGEPLEQITIEWQKLVRKLYVDNPELDGYPQVVYDFLAWDGRIPSTWSRTYAKRYGL